MAVLICHNCGAKYAEPEGLRLKEFVCQNCGAVNVVPQGDGAGDEPLNCLAPTGFEWKLPAGRIGNPVVGYEYITAQGTHMSREEYTMTFKIDPEIALRYMRGEREQKPFRLGRT